MRKTLLFALLVSLPSVILGFAAKKKGGKPKKSTSSSNKGFGAAPQTLESVLEGFPTRMPTDADSRDCPCGTMGKVYADCCGPLHRGLRPCLTPTDVLRSRYTAFTLRNIPYSMDTTHETCRDYREDRIAWAKDLNKGGMFDSFEFVNLEILGDAGPEEAGADESNEGFVEFKVTLRGKVDSVSTLAGQETAVPERARFLRDAEEGSWT